METQNIHIILTDGSAVVDSMSGKTDPAQDDGLITAAARLLVELRQGQIPGLPTSADRSDKSFHWLLKNFGNARVTYNQNEYNVYLNIQPHLPPGVLQEPQLKIAFICTGLENFDGLVEAWLRSTVLLPLDLEYGVYLRSFVAREGEFPVSLSDFDLMIVGGSAVSVYEDEKYPWITDLRAKLEQSVLNIKTLGICWGAQIMGSIYGLTVSAYPGDRFWGNQTLETNTGAMTQVPYMPESAFAQPLRIFEKHGDMITGQSTSVNVIATTLKEPHPSIVEIFTVGEHTLCLQGHPEYNYLNQNFSPTKVSDLSPTDLDEYKPIHDIVHEFIKHKLL